MQSLLLTVPEPATGQRLDRWLTEQFPDRSRTEIQAWIAEGYVMLHGERVKAGHKLAAAEQFSLNVPDLSRPSHLQPEDIPLSIIFENENLLVIDKPAGMVVHPAPGHYDGTVVNAVLHHVPEMEGMGDEMRPGLVHRLDKDTSGLLVVAKNDQTLRYLQNQFQDRTVYKEYLALVEGRMQPDKGMINAPIARHPTERKKFTVPSGMYKFIDGKLVASSDGKPAVTEYETVAVYNSRLAALSTSYPFSLVRIVLHTGRTHQIRVHFSHVKRPLVGDTLYGPSKPRLPINRQFLHAHRLHIRLPGEKELRQFVSPLAADLQELLNKLEKEEKGAVDSRTVEQWTVGQ